MFKRFYPDLRCESIDSIPDEYFLSHGIRYAILDIDNTIVAYTSPLPDERALGFLGRLGRLGIKYCFVSNKHILHCRQPKTADLQPEAGDAAAWCAEE